MRVARLVKRVQIRFPGRGADSLVTVTETRADTAPTSMRDREGLGWMLVGTLLASFQFNLYIGLPAYLILVRVSEQLTLLPSSPLGILVLIGCLTPVSLYCVWVGYSETPAAEEARIQRQGPPTGAEEALIQRLSAGEFDQEISSLTRMLGEEPENLSGRERAVRDSFDTYAELKDRMVEELVPQLAHLTPAEAFVAAKAEADSATAMAVRYKVWEVQLRELEEHAFIEQARLVEEEEVKTIDYARKMAAIYIERSRRGLPLPELPERGEAFALWGEINREVAAGRLDNETRRRLGRADAVWKMTAARDELEGGADT
jgi:hypothetical protein